MKKTVAIIGLIILCIYLFFDKEDESIKTYTTYEIKQEESTLIDTKPKEVKLVTIKVPVKEPFETKVTDTVWEDKEVKQYTYKDSLKNGILTSIILADKIYKRDISLKTTDTIINIETIRTLNKSQLFIGGTMTLNNNYKPLNPSLGLFYNRKNKWLGGVGIGYMGGAVNYSVTFAIKL